MSNFYTDVILKDPRLHSTSICNDLALLEPNMRRKVLAILSEAKAHGLELMVFETYRSPARQVQLFEQGRTKLRNVGCHGYGVAADLVRVVNGQPSWDGDFSLLGHLAHSHALVWGGDWKTFPDCVHVQNCRLSDQSRLFAGAFYPDSSYVAYP